MINSLTYLTRRCPRKCAYCALRDAKDVGKELNVVDWIEAFRILKELGVEFNLILGNETWLLGHRILSILNRNKVPYALYTTCPEPTFSKYRTWFFEGCLDNLSCGMDYPVMPGLNVRDDSYHKSVSALKGFRWVKKNYPEVDTHATITVHKKNLSYLPILAKQLIELGVFYAINFIHWNKDGKFDFFPKANVIGDLLFSPKDYPLVTKVLNEVMSMPGSLLQSPEVVDMVAKAPELLEMGWHCHGDPYGGPTIDADGKLRVCGYRRGTHTPKFSIFDLPHHIYEWREAVKKDAEECPGCVWLYPMQFHYWNDTDASMGRNVFVKHGGTHIEESKWSKRIIE
jgi:MoaA/NifB/PqqE/SkfB family radical SAM enzyme